MSAACSLVSRKRSRAATTGLAMALAMLAGSFTAVTAEAGAQKAASAPPPAAQPATPPGPKTPADDAMRVVLVKGGQPNCTTDCQEWISAEGAIVGGTTQAFENALQLIGDRKVPVFIASPGGDVDAALAIGHMLREHHLTVSVAKTTFSGCAPTDKVCGKERELADYRGTASTKGVECASSCVIILAAGDKRFVAPDAKIGVHQVATVMFENISSYKFSKYDVSDSIIQIERELVSERLIPRARMQVSNSAKIYREQLTPYFAEMGVSDKIVALMQKTDPAHVHWMTAKELLETKLVTTVGSVDAVFAPPPAPVAALELRAMPDVAVNPVSPAPEELRRSE